MFKSLRRPKTFYISLLTLFVPIVLQNVLNSSLALADTMMVGQLGETEVASVALANNVFRVVNLLIFGLQSGSSILFSQYWGKRDIAAINRILGIVMAVSVGVTLVIASLCFAFAEPLMSAINKDPEVVRGAAVYIRIVAFSFVLNAAFMIYIGAQRSLENPRLGLIINTTSLALNTGLNYLMIFGAPALGIPQMGVAGAALATLISRAAECLITVVYALFVRGRLPLMPKFLFRPGLPIFRDFLRYSMPIVLNETVWGLGFSLYTVVYSLMDTRIVAAISVSSSLEMVAMAFSFGLGAVAAVMVGKSLGAGDNREAIATGDALNTLSFIVGGVLCLVMLAVSPLFIGLFRITEETHRIASYVVMTQALMIPLRANIHVNVVGVLRAGGDTLMVLLIDSGVMWVFTLPLCALLGLVFHAPYTVVVLMFPLEDIIKMILGKLRYHSGSWIKNLTRSEGL